MFAEVAAMWTVPRWGIVRILAWWLSLAEILASQWISTYASQSPTLLGLGELLSPWSMSIVGLSKTISETDLVSFLAVNFCPRMFSLFCILGEIYTSFSFEESMITMLPSSLVIHRLVLCLLPSEDSLGLWGEILAFVIWKFITTYHAE